MSTLIRLGLRDDTARRQAVFLFATSTGRADAAIASGLIVIRADILAEEVGRFQNAVALQIVSKHFVSSEGPRMISLSISKAERSHMASMKV